MKKQKITKDIIADTAIKMMAEKGIDNVSMNEIAEKLGITKPSIYYHFKDKDELVKYSFDVKSEEISEIRYKLKNVYSLEELIEKVILSHYNFFSKNKDNLKCFFRIIDSDKYDHFRKMAKEIRNKNREDLRKMLYNFEYKGRKLSKNEIELTVNFISSLISYMIMEIKINDKIEIKSIFNIIKVFLKGLAVFLIVFLFTVKIFSAEITIDDAVNISLENNISVLNAYTSEKIYKEKIREYYGGVYPQISLNAGYTRNIEKPVVFFDGKEIKIGSDNDYSLSIDLQQILWSGGKVDASVRMAEIYADISKENTLMEKRFVKKSVKTLFYSILYSQKLVSIQKKILDLSNEHLETVKRRFSQGLANDLDVLRQRVEVSNNEPDYIRAENLYRTGVLNLKDLLGFNLEDDLNLKGDFNCDVKSTDFDELYKKALLNRNDYRLALLNKRMLEKNLIIEKAGHWPVLNMFASRKYSGSTDKSFPDSNEGTWSFMVGVNLKIPIFSGFSVVSRVKQAEYELEIARRNIDDLKRKIKIEIKNTLFNLDESNKRVESQKVSVENARKMLEATEERFKNGLVSQLDLNDIMLAYQKAELGYAKALYDYCVNAVNLDFVTGN